MSPLAWGRPCIAEKIGQGISLPDVAKEIVASRLTASDEAEEKGMRSAITVGYYVPSARIFARHRPELPKEGTEIDVSRPELPVIDGHRSAIELQNADRTGNRRKGRGEANELIVA